MVTFMFFSAKAGRFKSNVQIRRQRHWNYKKLQSFTKCSIWLMDSLCTCSLCLLPIKRRFSIVLPVQPGLKHLGKINLFKTNIFKALNRCSSPNHLYTPFWLPNILNILVPQGPRIYPSLLRHPMALRTPPRHSSRALRLNQPSHAPKSEQETSWVGVFFWGVFLLKKPGYLNFAVFCGFFLGGRRCSLRKSMFMMFFSKTPLVAVDGQFIRPNQWLLQTLVDEQELPIKS